MNSKNKLSDDSGKITLTSTQKAALNKFKQLHTRVKFGRADSNTDKRTKQFVMFGLTGDGKSTFGNLLLKGRGYNKKNPVFIASGAAGGCTQDVEKEKGHWLGDPREEEFIIVDTPGMNDADCTNETRLASIITDLQKLGYMHAFIMVFNGATPRFSEAHKQMIAIYQGVFGIKLFTNMVIVFTRWGMSEEDKEDREDEDITEELRSKEFNKHISTAFPEDFHAATDSIPCFFLDSLDFIRRREGYLEMEKSLENLWKHIRKLPAYNTIDMKQLNKEVEENAEKVKILTPLLKDLKEDKRHAEKVLKLERERDQMLAELQRLREEQTVFVKAKSKEVKNLEECRQKQRAVAAQRGWFDMVKAVLPTFIKSVFRMFRHDDDDDDDEDEDEW